MTVPAGESAVMPTYARYPLTLVRGEHLTVWDDEGTAYLDFAGALGANPLGHGHPAWRAAIHAQVDTLDITTNLFSTLPQADLARRLGELLPVPDARIFFCNSGAEANEAAIKIARMYTGKHKIIARYTSYHGSTAGSIAATGDLRRWYAEPAGKIPGVVFGPEVNCYRCPLGRTYPECDVACADYLGYMIDHEENVAAVIVEPVVGTNGVLVPPKEYLPRLAEQAKKRGVLLIADEVMSGWGRTGEWFAVDNWGVVPDILTTAKGITGALAPLGLVATTREIANFFDDHYFAHGHTYEAHPLTLAPAIAAIDEYKRLDLLNRAKTMGAKLEPKLKALQEKHPSIGDVRGLGLFWAVELVKDRKSKEPMNTPQEKAARKALVVDQVAAEMMKRGVSVVSWVSHLVIAPPLIVTEEQLDEAVSALDAALAVADSQVAA
ncbi:MAG TPA: aspartate aminotransferase family protein [Thermoanaerobaculia bacterium]|nr:aspartate aminotransferase family protein [Thermoanaerobaculia bacterium]